MKSRVGFIRKAAFLAAMDNPRLLFMGESSTRNPNAHVTRAPGKGKRRATKRKYIRRASGYRGK